MFRLRVGAEHADPTTDWSSAAAQRCDVAQPKPGVWSFTAGETRLELAGAPLSSGSLHREQPVLASITDEQFAAARRDCRRSAARGRASNGSAAFALASGEPVYGLGEKFGPLNKRGQLVHSQVEDALGVNTGRVVQERAVLLEPGQRQRQGRRLGRVRPHARRA